MSLTESGEVAAAEPPRLLVVSGLRVSYGDDYERTEVVRGVDFAVDPGQVVALVGESGSGKSTTAQSLIGLLPAGGRIDSGRVVFDGRDVTSLSRRELRELRGRSIGYIPQDPMTSLNPVRRVGEQVSEALRIHGLADRRSATRQAVDMLREAGLSDPAARARQFPHQLSGGMRQRALIASAFSCRPRLVIADEPTSALDVTVQRRILDHIDELKAEFGTAMLMITHDLGIAADRADVVAVMSRGVVVETGPAHRVFEDPQHDYTKRLVASARALAGSGPQHHIGWERGGSEPRSLEDPLLRVRGLTKEFELSASRGGDRTLRAVDDVSFSLERGTTLALVGESGSGKSTVARLVMGLETASAGDVHFGGRDIASLSRPALREVRRNVQMVYQSPFASLDPRYTIRRIILEPLRAFRVGSPQEREAWLHELMDHVELPRTMLGRKPAELSGGQRQRVAIARALALRPDLVVCDEPTSALDVTIQAQVLDLLSRLQRDFGVSYLFISHDLAVVRQIATSVCVMKSGRIVESGSVDKVFTSPENPYTRDLLAAIPGSRPATPTDHRQK